MTKTQTTKTVGLCLGWGGAKWLAHVGVLRYLDEHDIHVSEIGATSMGAIVGAMYAFGKDWKEISQIMETFRYNKYFDLGLKDGFLKGKRVQSFLYDLFGWKTIGDANIPLKIMACDIDSGEEYIFGPDVPVDVAVRASFSIPVIFSPVIWDGRKLVDGGLVNNLPVNHLTSETRIASSVISYQDPIIHKKVFLGVFRKRKASLELAREYIQKSYAILQNKGEQLSLLQVPDTVSLHHIRVDCDVHFHHFAATEQAIYHGYKITKQYFERQSL